MDDNSAYNPQQHVPQDAGYAQQPQAPMPPSQPPQPQHPTGQSDAGAQQRPPLRIDHNLLSELGLAALPDDEKQALEKHIYETLEMNVGMRLADQMTNEQLDEFETYFNARDDAGAFRWLETNFPNYKDIVAEEFDKLKAEVARNAPHILSASQQQSHASAEHQPAAQPIPPQQPDYSQMPPQQQYGQPQPPQPSAYPQPPYNPNTDNQAPGN